MSEPAIRRGRTPLSATVTTTSWLTPAMVRVVCAGDELRRFSPNDFTDSYVKVMFLSPTADYPRPIDVDAIRQTMPSELWPRLRTYTVRRFDPSRAELTLDFVVHGTAGLAGPWAARAKPGDEILILGPGGGYAPDPDSDWHLFVGDESALPAIAVGLESLPSSATGMAFVEVSTAEHGIVLDAPAGVAVHWLHRERRPVGEAVVEAVLATAFPAGVVHAFVHGEAGMVKQLRRYLRIERGIPASRLSISGYWRAGTDDEGWRAGKAEWNRAIETEEAAAGAA